MKTKIFLTTLLMFFYCEGFSQNDLKSNKGFDLGFQLNQFQQDFGIGLNVAFPAIINDRLVIHLRGNWMWNQHIYNNQSTWSDYANVMLGLSSPKAMISKNIGLYGEGGAIAILPNQRFSSKNAVFGGYGLFGFEFFFDPTFNYFIELGGVGSRATEDNLPEKGIYSNGFITTVGFRVCL